VLTRGQAPVAMAPNQIDFRPYLSITFGYDTGLNGVSVDPNGNPVNSSGAAIQANAGISGFHSWKHTTVGLDFRAAFNHYPSQSYYDGSNELLLLSVTHLLSRHVMFSLRENAGIFTDNFGFPVLQQTVPFDPSTTYVPTNDFYDNRTAYLSTQADLMIQRSTRLSFDIGGDGFLVRRRSDALYGNTGAAARGDIQYRISRRSTLGVGYNYTHFSFTGIFSSTDMHTVVASYAIRLTRTVEFSATGGFTRFENKFLQNVPIDPAIAAIICAPGAPCVSSQVSYFVDYIPSVTARISKVVPRGVIYASGGHSVTPGNGLFLTSTSTMVSGGYSYTGLKKWSITSGVSYMASDSVANVQGSYSSVVINLSASRHLFRATNGVLTFAARKYGSGDFNNYNLWQYSVRLGLAFTPGDIPLRLW